MRILKGYYWPGNVRELENLVQCLSIMAENELIDVSDLPSLMRFSVNHRAGFSRTLAEVDAEYIRNVLASVNGNKTRPPRSSASTGKHCGITWTERRDAFSRPSPPEGTCFFGRNAPPAVFPRQKSGSS